MNPPESYFFVCSGGKYQQYVNEPVEFTGTFYGGTPNYTWFWDFNDGFSSTEQNPAHTFDEVGWFNVKVILTDNNGLETVDTAMVQIIHRSDVPIFVDDDYDQSTSGWLWDHFNTIQKGVEVSDNSGQVFVNEGIYYENLIIQSPISLIGENPENTIIIGQNNYNNYPCINVIEINTNNCNISGFTITINITEGYYQSGIYIERQTGNIIKNNIFIGDRIGVWLDYSSDNIIEDNIFNTHARGMYLFGSNDNEINKNKISNCWHGVEVSSSHRNIVQFNIVNNCSNGITIEAPFDTSYDNEIIRNSVSKCGIGIYILYSSRTIITENNIIDNNQQAKFVNAGDNSWNHNYWNRPRLLPKIIFGVKGYKAGQLDINFDWRHALKPFDIPK